MLIVGSPIFRKVQLFNVSPNLLHSLSLAPLPYSDFHKSLNLTYFTCQSYLLWLSSIWFCQNWFYLQPIFCFFVILCFIICCALLPKLKIYLHFTAAIQDHLFPFFSLSSPLLCLTFPFVSSDVICSFVQNWPVTMLQVFFAFVHLI